MSLGLDVKRAFRKSRYIEPSEQSRFARMPDNADSKARHILGLTTTNDVGPARNNSNSSTSTNRLRSLTISDATTAASSIDIALSTAKGGVVQPEIRPKTSSVLLKRQRKGQTDDPGNYLQTYASHTSLRSFYDKSRAPLHVSQQTSDSSSRDFALRRGAPSVISASSQEMEHSKQLKFFSRLSKKTQYDKNRLAPLSARPSTNSSQPSVVSSIFETRSDAGESTTSQVSLPRISVTRGSPDEQPASFKPTKHPTKDQYHPFPMTKPVIDPARAKVNVRRPKAGTKDWFDNLDTDSSDEEQGIAEPQLESDFEAVVTTAFKENKIDKFLPHSPSRASTPSNVRGLEHMPVSKVPTRKSSQNSMRKLTCSTKPRRRERNPFDGADLHTQSILSLSSSDDETEGEPQSAASYQELARREIRASLMSAPLDTNIEVGQALVVDAREREKLMLALKNDSYEKPPVPPRASSRKLTYLDDRSTDTLKQQEDLLKSFPQTPSEPTSRAASVRDSFISEDESIVSTKLMTVTRQEENLIAAMRLKKSAMKRAQAMAHRKGALRMLEQESSNLARSHSSSGVKGPDRLLEQITPASPLRLSYLASPSTARAHTVRPDSGTTFQTDSLRERSLRSSIATYTTEGSDDLQLPYSSIHGLPLGSSEVQRAVGQSRRPARDTFLSDITTTTTATDKEQPSECSPGERGSHVVALDPLERQLLRQDIPSQLFMERPFVGWEARANMQTAH